MASNISSLSSQRENFFKGGLDKAYKASCAAYNTDGIVTNEDGSTVVIALPGPLDMDYFGETNKFGACKINTNNDYFIKYMVEGIVKKELPPQPALVHQGILNSFLHVWNNNKVEEQVKEYIERGKTVLFTGHSIGGGIATLATLATLEKWPKYPSVFCITFGFPLIGDEVLARAIRRQRWANQFCHVVSKGDIFARILLAPSTSISEPLRILLPYCRREMQQRDNSSDIPMEETIPENVDITKLLRIVLQHASLVVNYTSAINMDPTNKVLATVRPLVKVSPYRAFGNYIFCSGSGAVWVENDEAVLPMLYYSLVAAAAEDQDQASISEHIGYGRLLYGAMTNMVKLEELSNLSLSQVAHSLYQNAIETQLEALGFGIQIPQARLALKAAGQVEKQRKENMKQVEGDLDKLVNGEGCMPKLKKYRSDCLTQRRIPFYDCFKQHKSEVDFQANINRLKLAGFWDRVAEMVEKHELPDEFQRSDDWIRVGTEYRLLVEPLDIANYYRLEKHEDSGHYLSFARPRRYSYLQKWLADKELIDNEGRGILYPEIENMTKDSRFWAYVEEISWSMNNKKENTMDVREKCKEFQKRVKHMLDSNDLCVDEVMLGESSFRKWWNQLSEEERAASPIKTLFQS